MPEANRSVFYESFIKIFYIIIKIIYLYFFIFITLYFHWDILWQPIFEVKIKN